MRPQIINLNSGCQQQQQSSTNLNNKQNESNSSSPSSSSTSSASSMSPLSSTPSSHSDDDKNDSTSTMASTASSSANSSCCGIRKQGGAAFSVPKHAVSKQVPISANQIEALLDSKRAREAFFERIRTETLKVVTSYFQFV